MFRTILTATLVAFAPACSKRSFLFQTNSIIKGQDIDLTVDRPSEADILVVIDSSNSMQPHQDNLKRNAAAFINELAKSPNKFQIGITTTHATLCSNVAPSPNPWDGQCGRLLSPDGADPIMRRTDYVGNDAGLIQRFQDIVGAVGILGSGYEEGLKAAALAVDPELVAPGRPNAGFLRPDALLGIVILSDETDCSFSFDQQTGYSQFIPVNLAPGQSCYEFADKLEPVKNWAARLASDSVKGRASLVAVGAITAGSRSQVGFTPGQCSIGSDGEPTTACSCFNRQPLAFCAYTTDKTAPSGQVLACGDGQGGATQCCEGPSCCLAMGNPRYVEFADYFRLRYKDSICRNAYDQTLIEIARIFQRDCFTLEKGPPGDNADWIKVQRRQAETTEYLDVPRVADSSGDGWYYFFDTLSGSGDTVAEVCLAGSYKRVIGDSYRIQLVSEVEGLGTDEPATPGATAR